MRSLSLFVFTFISVAIFAQAELKPPAEYLPTNYGKDFTLHHLVVDYFEYVAKNSELVHYEKYGYSTEGRQLGMGIITSKDNMANLEEIRKNNLRLAGLLEGKGDLASAKAIVWINFGVHGNEAGATESSLNILYQLITAHQDWLENIIVILNPSLNPDGFDRYVAWNKSVSHQVLMPSEWSREHHEPWPTGRMNHYQFDLNRDWSWAVQQETKALLDVYHKWMPQVVPDLHEQSPNSSFYFAPAAHPFHEYVTPFQKDFQYKVGQENAAVFDKKGWLYFSKEIFDLFYPGYGDTYSTFNGAVGMTFEQAGHGKAGKGYVLDTRDTLMLMDRIEHHTAASLATIAVVAKYRKELVKGFRDYFVNSQSRTASNYQGFVVKKSNGPYKLEKLMELLDRHQIRYASVTRGAKGVGFDYQKLKETPFEYTVGDLVIPSVQPMGVLANVLMEPESFLEDSLTYDVTAWALPYAYGLDAYAVVSELPPLSAYAKKELKGGIRGYGNYAWMVDWNNVSSAAFLGDLLQKGVNVRYATKPFTRTGKIFARGSLLISKDDNQQIIKKLPKLLADASIRHKVPVYAMETGFSELAPDFGSRGMKLIHAPKIAVVYGDDAEAYRYGEMWHFLDKELEYPFVSLAKSYLKESGIYNFTTIVLVGGDYTLPKRSKGYLRSWIKKGGRLILMGNACNVFSGDERLGLSIREQLEVDDLGIAYEDRERKNLVNSVPGGIVEVLMDSTHPLGYGYHKRYYSMKTSQLSYGRLKGGGVMVGRTGAHPKTIGFFGSQFKAELGDNLVFGLNEYGQGQVVYLVDNPLFRGFWRSGELLMANALFFE